MYVERNAVRVSYKRDYLLFARDKDIFIHIGPIKSKSGSKPSDFHESMNIIFSLSLLIPQFTSILVYLSQTLKIQHGETEQEAKDPRTFKCENL